MRVGRLELPRPNGQQILSLVRLPIPPYSQKNQVIGLPSLSKVGGLRRQYSLKVIFISLYVRPQLSAAFGKFHFAENNISMDCRVSGLI